MFLSTDAGGVGLNLQSGSVLVNIDIPWNPAVLEQRIARIHRMGQIKPVRIINFVSQGSIEESILSLLKFKKSLFAGALDEDGLDLVMREKSQMEQFITSVEEALSGLDRGEAHRNAIVEEEESAGADDVVDESEESLQEEEPPRPIIDPGQKALNDLLEGGARFLMGLSQAMSPKKAGQGAEPESAGVTVDSIVQRFIAKDEASGKPCLKIPIPEPEVVNSIVSGLQQLFKSFSGGSNR